MQSSRRRPGPAVGVVPAQACFRRDDDAARHRRLTEALGALDVKLTDANLAALAEGFPPGAAAGGRYAEDHLKDMDSEKPATAS
ncbi:MAG: hypothetical protein V7632_1673 [Bradyrhizobium sp.]|jgi:hypothetical protein